MGAPMAPPPAEGAGEDLLGLTSDIAAPAPEQPDLEQPATPAAAGELPEWLRGLKPTAGVEIEAGEAALTMAEGLSSDELQDISDLRFETIMGHAPKPETASTEKVGALKDVTGAIRPELIFDAQTLKAGHVVSDTVLTKDQERRILLLEELLAHKQAEVVITRGRPSRVPLVRWLIAALMILAVAVPIVLRLSLLSAPAAPSGGVGDVHQIVSSLPDNAKVLVAFEYEPDTAAEMDPLARVLLHDLAARQGMRVLAISTRPLGTGMADQAFREAPAPSQTAAAPTDSGAAANPAAQEEAQWANLGYLPGGPTGVTSLVTGGLGVSPFSQDYLAHPTGLGQPTLGSLAPNLIIVLAASGDDLRAWIEQAGRPTGIPMVAATSVSAAPQAVPYRQSGQLAAVMSGVNDAAAYGALAQQPADQPLVAVWNAQAVGALAAAAIIVVGGLITGLMAAREQREQNA